MQSFHRRRDPGGQPGKGSATEEGLVLEFGSQGPAGHGLLRKYWGQKGLKADDRKRASDLQGETNQTSVWNVL